MKIIFSITLVILCASINSAIACDDMTLALQAIADGIRLGDKVQSAEGYRRLFDLQKRQAIDGILHRTHTQGDLDLDVSLLFDPNSDFEHKAVIKLKSLSGRGLSQEFASFFAAASFDITSSDGVPKLVCSIDVQKDYRELRLSRLILLAILAEHPEIRYFPASLQDINEALFLLHVTLDLEGDELTIRANDYVSNEIYARNVESLFQEEIRGARTPKQKQKLRKKIIRAYYQHTAAGRLRNSIGFLEVKQIVIDRNLSKEGVDISADAAFGNKLPDDAISIVVHTFDPSTKRTESYSF